MTRCSTGACVRVDYDQAAGLIRVTDTKHPDKTGIAWTPEVWTSAVLARVVEGLLPAGASEFDGGVVWRGVDEHSVATELEFDGDEWTAFGVAVEAGEYDVPRILGA